ncbi:MAG: hypothetical protein JEY91_01935 [Spirochaetaceae bacterium]|nr:hypothetical protein [Spirochaetaceae bacterium]
MKKIKVAAADYESDETKYFAIDFSFGLAEFEENLSVDDFIKSADKQMYKNKN